MFFFQSSQRNESAPQLGKKSRQPDDGAEVKQCHAQANRLTPAAVDRPPLTGCFRARRQVAGFGSVGELVVAVVKPIGASLAWGGGPDGGRYRNRAAIATKLTATSSPCSSHASSADGNPAILTISGSRNCERSAGKSATNSSFRFAAPITESFAVMVTRSPTVRLQVIYARFKQPRVKDQNTLYGCFRTFFLIRPHLACCGPLSNSRCQQPTRH